MSNDFFRSFNGRALVYAFEYSNRTRVRGANPCAGDRSPGPRANVVSSVSRCPRPLVSGRFRPRTQERGALCGQGTLRP